MRRSTRVILTGCVLLALVLLAYAQRPPDFSPDGVPFLKVNINPTEIPPEVNINPIRRFQEWKSFACRR